MGVLNSPLGTKYLGVVVGMPIMGLSQASKQAMKSVKVMSKGSWGFLLWIGTV